MEVEGDALPCVAVEPLRVFPEAGDFGQPELECSLRRFETRQRCRILRLSSVLSMPICSSQSLSKWDRFLREWRMVEIHWHAEIGAASLQSTPP